MSQRRVALSLSDRAAARLSRDRPWAQSQPNSSGNRNRPALTSPSTQPQSTSIQMNRLALRSVPTRSTQPQSIPISASSNQSHSTSIRMNRPALHTTPTRSTQPQSIPISASSNQSHSTSIRMNRPALHTAPARSTQPQSIPISASSNQSHSTSIRMNRPALHTAPTRSTQSQSISNSASSTKPHSTSIRMNRPALHTAPTTSTQPQPMSRIRMNRPALQLVTTARPAPSTVDLAKPKTVLERAQARSERLSAAKHADARHVADKPFSEIISEVRCLQARIAAYKAGKAESTAATSRQQIISPAVSTRSQRRPRAPSPMTILIDSLDYRDLSAARSAPAPHLSPPPSPAPFPPRLVAPSAFKAPRFHDVRAQAIDFPAFPKPKGPPSQLKGILRKASRRYKPDCKGDRCCSQYSSAKKKVAFKLPKKVAFAMNDEVHEHEKWIGICQGTESDAQKFTDCGQPISGRGLHVYPDLTRFLGQLRGWLPVPGDNYNYTYFRGVNWRDHSDCPRGLAGRGCERGRRHRRFEALCPNFYGNVDLATLKNIEKECGPPGDEFSTERFRDNTP